MQLPMEIRSAIARRAARQRWANTTLDQRYAFRRRIAEAKRGNTDKRGFGPLLSETPLWAKLEDGERLAWFEQVHGLLALDPSEAEERWTEIARRIGRRGDVYAL